MSQACSRTAFILALVLATLGARLSWGQSAEQVSTIKLEISSPALADLTDSGVYDIVFVAADTTGPMGPTPVIIGGGCGGGDLIIDPLGANGGKEVLTIDPSGGIVVDTPGGGGLGDRGRGDLRLHVLRGDVVPPYSQERAGFPQRISSNYGCHPTVFLAKNFRNDATFVPNGGSWVIAVGGDKVYAFMTNGGNIPAYPYSDHFPPFWNAGVFKDVNNDGLLDMFRSVARSPGARAAPAPAARWRCSMPPEPRWSTTGTGDRRLWIRCPTG